SCAYLSAKVWAGQPVETDEMKPTWCTLDQIPFEWMWSDAVYWLPSILKGQKINACFVFKDDNETVDEMSIEEWPDDVQGRQITR
ncbi:MAG: hypothetical protein NT075_17005, partial [Chloroflexi bacterium]|nr:hypothetical protein [Chloroflexota bacterium]